MARGRVNQTVLPCPSVLEAPMVPCIISTNCLAMVVPRPEPPYSRVVELLAWVKASNMDSSLDLGMPTPVS